ncbi:MAG: YwqG family protein [Saprospiraceae bacterium]
MQLDLPAAIEPFRDRLLATRRTFVRVSAQPARATSWWESKVGGQPYLPKGIPFPAAPDGRELVFLAQINFADMPRLHPFPERGIVQFYINDDDLYGMDFDDGECPDMFRTLFFPDPTTDVSALQTQFTPSEDEDILPHHPETTYPLAFVLSEEVAPSTDYQFWQTFGSGFFQQFGQAEWDVQDAFNRSVRSDGHKIGGYAYFTQDDPRRPEDPMLLLFQLDSDEGMDLMWGDMGVGHFFIREKDLVARDFSRVLYDWDCL